MASLVMRRDLALCRERNAIASPEPMPEPEAAPTTVDEIQPIPHSSGQPVAKPANGAVDGDHLMTDASQPAEDAKPTATTLLEQSKSEETTGKQLQTDSPPTADTDRPAKEPEDSKAPSSLQIDTGNQSGADPSDARPQSKDSNKPPDTADAFSANADLDSLFNDTNSAAGGDMAGDGIDFNTAGDSEFDFDGFNTLGDSNNDGGNDLSSLLPGLEQYANHPSQGGEADFSAVFNTDGNGSGTGHSQNQAGQLDIGGDVNDSVLEDFMDFAGLGDDNGGGNGSGDIDFGFDFS
ncbi:hypothetical protein K431DRAFT_15776 [Polychaeton citri CBS 116435]|uniref:Uncharacterized protein n=1 Tax=Polychaeton citri CBS 116435 TaxID=1314669 RepID=A0A9P4QAI4_9PEZI|nr:hypothetical protein K431DRAFT_15776 [Polychaeton citri CBS 116435]